VRQNLEKDEKLLRRLVFVVLRSLETVPRIDPSFPGTSFSDTTHNEDVRKFWSEEFGEDVLFVPHALFSSAIRHWIKGDLNSTVCDDLALRIDEFAIGGVTQSSLDKFAGSQKLEAAILDLEDQLHTPHRPKSRQTHRSKWMKPSRPWLIWIDDVPSHNKKEILHAEKKLGVKVFSFPSTASVKAWIDANETRVREQDAAGCLRFVSDNTRWELRSRWQRGTGAGSSFLDLSAGETILRFLRGRGYNAPVLVLCDLSLPSTGYVEEYERAGSTRSLNVTRAYIQSLGKGEESDIAWAKFGAIPERRPVSYGYSQ